MRAWTSMLTGSLIAVGLAANAIAADSRTVQRQVDAQPSGEVVVNNVNGSIDIIGWERPQVAASAELHGADLDLEIASNHGRTEVRITGYSHDSVPVGLGEALLTVHVPRQSSVAVNAVSADVRSTGVQGAQRLQSVNGAVKTDLAASTITVHTINGAIDLRGEGHQSSVDASSVSGPITLENAGGDLRAHTVSGKLQATLSPAHQVSLHSISGAITLAGSLERDAMLEAHSISGKVHIDTAAPAGFSYQARSFSGHLDDCFGVPAEHQDRFGPDSRSLAGTRGAGGAQIRVSTLSGDVSLCDRNTAKP